VLIDLPINRNRNLCFSIKNQFNEGMVESIKNLFVKSYIFYLFTGYFSSYNRNWKFLAFFLLKFEKNPDFLAFFTKVIPKLTCFWHFFTKVELFFLINEKKGTFFPLFDTNFLNFYAICVILRKELREKEHFVHMFEEKVTFLLLFLLKVTYFY